MKIPATTSSKIVMMSCWDFQCSPDNQQTDNEGHPKGRGIDPVNK